MQKTYEFNISHYAYFNHLSRLKNMKSAGITGFIKTMSYAIYFLIIVMILCFLDSSTYLSFKEDSTLLGLQYKYWTSISLIIIAIGIPLCDWLYRTLCAKVYLQPDGNILGHWTLNANEQNIEILKTGVRNIYDWTQFKSIYVDDFLVVLWSGPAEGVMIPTNTFSSKSEFDEFIRFSRIEQVEYKISF